MLKETITYVDYNGTERTEDFYFNLTRAEIIEMELETTGGLVEMMNRIIASQDSRSIKEQFKKHDSKVLWREESRWKKIYKVRRAIDFVFADRGVFYII